MQITRKLTEQRFPRWLDGTHASAIDGGYPTIWFSADATQPPEILTDPICAECADTARDRGEIIVGFDIFYEGSPEACPNCGIIIESAYGDPSEDD